MSINDIHRIAPPIHLKLRELSAPFLLLLGLLPAPQRSLPTAIDISGSGGGDPFFWLMPDPVRTPLLTVPELAALLFVWIAVALLRKLEEA